MSDTLTNLGIQQALERVRIRIGEAALRAGRNPSEVMLLAISKTFPAQAVLEAVAAGQHDFGENRIEEALPKIREIRDSRFEIHWHLIGHVQSRKVKDAIGHFDLIHSIDTVKLAIAINNRVSTLQPPSPIPHPLSPIPQSILLECNVSGEESKSGFRVAGWESDQHLLAAFVHDVEQIAALPNVRVRGLMTMAPIVDHPAQARPYFASLRALRDVLRQRFPAIAWDHLSMGMTDDFEAAIAEGATLVRIGRAIFGERTHA